MTNGKKGIRDIFGVDYLLEQSTPPQPLNAMKDPKTFRIATRILHLLDKVPENRSGLNELLAKTGMNVKEVRRVIDVMCEHGLIELSESTVASLVASPATLGQDKVDQRSFQQVASRDLATLNLLPEVYEIDDLDPEKRTQIEHWINHELVRHRDRLNEQEFRGIWTCLVAVLFDDETSFLSTILQLYGPIERELRRLQRPFISKLMGPEKVEKTVQDALDGSAKELEHLSLGDRLDLYVYVTKLKQLSSDPKIVGSWMDEAQLRDAAAHFSEKPFPNWHTQLPILIRFLRRYKALCSLIKSVLKAT
jgi:hypothetical protein